MKKITILLLGITGNLAKLKILPAIGQFAKLNKDQLECSLIGYSRSNPDTEKIMQILDDHGANKDNLKSISYVVDDYDKVDNYQKIIEGLDPDERLIIYLAAPPLVFIPFLKIACPLNPGNIDIVIEKPFGQNLSEAIDLINISTGCNLTKQIHFFDHYLFKNSSILDAESLEQIKALSSKKIKNISIKSLESVNVGDRGGYYESIGAIKDMWQHLFSLCFLLENSLEKDFSWETFNVEKITTGQYQTYIQDVNLPSSFTETYFKALTNLSGIPTTFESGKSLGQKNTTIQLEFVDGFSLRWNIDTEKFIQIKNSAGETIYSKSLAEGNLLDHTNLFCSILDVDNSKFITPENVIFSWETFNELLRMKNPQPGIYSDGKWPIVFLED
jgi:glucose-6-phosphate 1-dehydrogenase